MSQDHGFVFEDSVIRNITGFSKDDYQKNLDGCYTASMDIVKDIFSDQNYSIKTSKGGSGVGCGDILRFNDHCSHSEFIMIVGAWNQITPTLKRYNTIYEFYFNPLYHNILWSNLTREALEPFVNYVKSIPPGKKAQLDNRKLWKEKREELYQTYGKGLISIDAKIDSKTQRRVQCSFKISDLINSGIPYKEYSDNYKGIKIPYEQNSTPRQFSKVGSILYESDLC